MEPAARHRMIMHVIDAYARDVAAAEAEEARAIMCGDATRRAQHMAAAARGREQAASVRVEVDQIISGLLGLAPGMTKPPRPQGEQ